MINFEFDSNTENSAKKFFANSMKSKRLCIAKLPDLMKFKANKLVTSNTLLCAQLALQLMESIIQKVKSDLRSTAIK